MSSAARAVTLIRNGNAVTVTVPTYPIRVNRD
jgi:hypothetical protein